jgi:uncharacterized protein YecT (DUF1311 family)
MKYFLSMFLLASVAGLAQESAQYRACLDSATSQMAMNTCASEEAGRAEARLNDVYRDLLSLSAKQVEALAKIKAAEKAWTDYRDAYLEAMYPAKDKMGEYGSVYLMEANLIRAKLTDQHTAELKEMVQQYSNEGR